LHRPFANRKFRDIGGALPGVGVSIRASSVGFRIFSPSYGVPEIALPCTPDELAGTVVGETLATMDAAVFGGATLPKPPELPEQPTIT